MRSTSRWHSTSRGTSDARPGLKEEQAAAITLLASDAASFITGQILSGGGAHL